MIEIDPQSLQQKLAGEKPPFLRDVRMPPELIAEGRIAGSVNIPMNELQQRLPRTPRQQHQRALMPLAHGINRRDG